MMDRTWRRWRADLGPNDARLGDDPAGVRAAADRAGRALAETADGRAALAAGPADGPPGEGGG